MDRQNVREPFDICIKSEKFPMIGLDGWRKDQLRKSAKVKKSVCGL